MVRWVRKQTKLSFLEDGISSRKNIEISSTQKSDHTGLEVSMMTYALQAFKEAKSLTSPISDSEIILKLARHYNEELRTTIIGRPITSLKELLSLLEKFDRIGPLNIQRVENSHRLKWVTVYMNKSVEFSLLEAVLLFPLPACVKK